MELAVVLFVLGLSLVVSLVAFQKYRKALLSFRVAQKNFVDSQEKIRQMKKEIETLKKGNLIDYRNPQNFAVPKVEKKARLRGELKDWEWGL